MPKGMLKFDKKKMPQPEPIAQGSLEGGNVFSISPIQQLQNQPPQVAVGTPVMESEMRVPTIPTGQGPMPAAQAQMPIAVHTEGPQEGQSAPAFTEHERKLAEEAMAFVQKQRQQRGEEVGQKPLLFSPQELIVQERQRQQQVREMAGLLMTPVEQGGFLVVSPYLQSVNEGQPAVAHLPSEVQKQIKDHLGQLGYDENTTALTWDVANMPIQAQAALELLRRHGQKDYKPSELSPEQAKRIERRSISANKQEARQQAERQRRK